MDLITFLTQLPIMAALVLFIGEFLAKYIKVDGWAARLETWIIAIGLVFLSDYIPVAAMFIGLTWIVKVIYGILIGVVANGLFTIEQLKSLLEKLGIRTFIPPKAS